MGGSISKKLKSNNDSAQIYMTLNSPYYYAGDKVTGNIYLNIFYSYPVNDFVLRLKGREKTHWRTSAIDEKTKAQQYRDHRGRIEIISSQCSLLKFNTAILPGHYSFPFTFTLPNNMPGTFEIKESPESCIKIAEIKYIIAATLTSLNKEIATPIEFKIPLKIRPLLHPDVVNKRSFRIDGYIKQGCFDKGHCIMITDFEKGVYSLGEEVKISATLDNSICKCRANMLRCELMQKIQIRANKVNNDSYEIENVVAQAEQAIYVEPFWHMETPVKIHLNIKSKHSVKSTYMIEPSITNGSIISCTYYLKVGVLYEGCFVKGPTIKFDIILYAPEFKASSIVEAPHNWNPIQYTTGEIVLTGNQMIISGLVPVLGNKEITASSLSEVITQKVPSSLELEDNMGRNSNIEMNINDIPQPNTKIDITFE